jgi:hypothetical protein
MACSRYQFRYGTGGVLSATYQLCGDDTPISITKTGGVSGAFYTTTDLPGYVVNGGGVIIASLGSVVTYTGFASAGGASVPGFVYTPSIAPWAQFVITNVVSAVSGTHPAQLPYIT